MAHNLSFVDGKAEMMYAGKAPWHNLGTFVGDKEVTAQEAIKAAHLDWKVVKAPAFYQKADGSFADNGGFVTVRQDTEKVLGRVGGVYTPLQNVEAFDFMDSVMGQSGAFYHTAGALGQGERVWILVKFNGQEEISAGDAIDSYLLLSNSHDGGSFLDIRLTTVRVVCANTLGMALSNKEKGLFYKFKHTTNIKNKAIDAQAGLTAVSEKFKKFVEAGRLLRAEEITRKELDDFLISLEIARANDREAVPVVKQQEFKRTEKYRQLVRAFETSPGSKMAGHSLWGAVNAVTYYYDHVSNPRDTGKYSSEAEGRLASAWFDGGADKKERAFSLALEFAGKR